MDRNGPAENKIGLCGMQEDDLALQEAEVAASSEARGGEDRAALEAREGELLAREARVTEEEEKLAERSSAIDARIGDLEKAARFLEERQAELRRALGGNAAAVGRVPVQQ